MADRYEIIDRLDTSYYTEHLPVIIKAGNLLTDTVGGGTYAQLKLLGISPKPIIAVEVVIHSFDGRGKPLEDCSYVFTSLTLYRDQTAGDNELIPLEDSRARTITPEVVGVYQRNGESFINDNARTFQVDLDAPLEDVFGGDKELIKQYKLAYGKEHNHAPSRLGELWLCSCGSFNYESEKVCHVCGSRMNEVIDPKMELLEEARDHRVAREKEKKKRVIGATKRIGIIVAAVLVAVLLISFIVTKLVMPEQKYNSALKDYESENYAAAYKEFLALGDYKDSADYASNAKDLQWISVYRNILEGSFVPKDIGDAGFESKIADPERTSFSLCMIDEDKIPELAVKIDEKIYFFGVSENDDGSISPPRLYREIKPRSFNASKAKEVGYYEYLGYISYVFKTKTGSYTEWIPLNPDYTNKFYRTYYKSKDEEYTDYCIEDGDDYYSERDAFYAELYTYADPDDYREIDFSQNSTEARAAIAAQ